MALELIMFFMTFTCFIAVLVIVSKVNIPSPMASPASSNNPNLPKEEGTTLSGLESYCRDFGKSSSTIDRRCLWCPEVQQSAICNGDLQKLCFKNETKSACLNDDSEICEWNQQTGSCKSSLSCPDPSETVWPDSLQSQDQRDRICRPLKVLKNFSYLRKGEVAKDIMREAQTNTLDPAIAGFSCDKGGYRFAYVSQSSNHKYNLREVGQRRPLEDAQGQLKFGVGESCLLGLEDEKGRRIPTFWNTVLPIND